MVDVDYRAPPPIVLVTALYPPAVGGTPVLFENVYRRLDGIAVTVLTDLALSPGRNSVSADFAVYREPMAMVHWGVLGPGAVRQHLRAAARLRRLGAGGGIVHCGRTLPEGLGAAAARLSGGAAYAVWVHGEELLYARQSRELWLLSRLVLRGASAVLANSRPTADAVMALGVPATRIKVVHPGVDPQRFAPVRDGSGIRARFARPDDLLLLTVGRLQRRKGHDLVLRALAVLAPADVRPVYVVVGTGDDRARLEAMAQELGVASQVHFAGEVSTEDLPRYYAACDVFVLPNRADGHDVEGFGIVFLEASASGRPVIGGRSGGVVDAIAENLSGLLVSGTDPHELAAAIRTLAESGDLRRRMGMQGRARVEAEFTWDRAAALVKSLHEGMTVPVGRSTASSFTSSSS